MAVQTPPAPPPTPAPGIEDGVIEDARARQRRHRRIGWALAAAAVATGALALVFVLRGSAGSGLQRVGRSGPLVDLPAMRRQGKLAFVSRGDLYLLDGSAGVVHEIPVSPGWTAAEPRISHDGRWVAYQVEPTGGNSYAPPQLWVARLDGSDRHRVTGADGVFGWSPSADLLAISTDTRAKAFRGFTDIPTRLELISPRAGRRTLVSLGGHGRLHVVSSYRVWNATWSPNGAAIAASLVSFAHGSTVRSYPVNGDAPTTWFTINAKRSLPGVCTGCGAGGTIADLAGWWPRWGIGFWVFSSGAIHNLDSTPLELLHTPGTTPRIIARTLSDGITSAVAASRTGSLAIVASSENAGRSYGQGKSVATCTPTSETCTPIPGASIWNGPESLPCWRACSRIPPGEPGSAVSIDPAWSPTQNLLAYVKSPESPNYGNPPLGWYAAHTLYVYDPAGDRSTKIAGISGVSVPTWSRNGKSLLYVDNDALWLAPATGGTPTKVATPLFSGARWLDNATSDQSIAFYGQIPWTSQFDWWSPPTQ